jgi:hypothetical protein
MQHGRSLCCKLYAVFIIIYHSVYVKNYVYDLKEYVVYFYNNTLCSSTVICF